MTCTEPTVSAANVSVLFVPAPVITTVLAPPALMVSPPALEPVMVKVPVAPVKESPPTLEPTSTSKLLTVSEPKPPLTVELTTPVLKLAFTACVLDTKLRVLMTPVPVPPVKVAFERPPTTVMSWLLGPIRAWI